MKTLSHPLLDGSPYRGYAYAYPHKTAYRPLTTPIRLGEDERAGRWRGQERLECGLHNLT